MHKSIGLLLSLRANAVRLAMECTDLDTKPLLDLTYGLLTQAGELPKQIDEHDAQVAKFYVEWEGLTQEERNARHRETARAQLRELERPAVDAMVSDAVGRECALTEDEPGKVAA
jgi:hypothetical protein